MNDLLTNNLLPALKGLEGLFAFMGIIIAPLWFFYNRLDSKIGSIDTKIDELRKEIREDKNAIEQKMREDRKETDRKFERMDQKLDNIISMMFTQKQVSRAGHFHKKNKDVV